MKKFIIGILLGGLLLSGGWFTWGAIQSEVGGNLWDAVNSKWIRSGAVTSTAGNASVGMTTAQGLPASAMMGRSHLGSITGNYYPLVTCGVGTCDEQTFNSNNPVVLLTTAVMAGSRGSNTFATASNSPNNGTENAASSLSANWVHALLAATNGEGALTGYSAAVLARDTGNDAIPVTAGGSAGAQPIATVNFPAEFNNTTFDRVRSAFTQSTTGITTNAAGTTVTMTTTPMSKYTMIIDRTAGTTDVVEIDLQCSINNTAFVQIATITSLVNEPVLTSIGDIPCAYMRYNVVTVGSGNTVSIDLLATR
jgi:hypothetical protein